MVTKENVKEVARYISDNFCFLPDDGGVVTVASQGNFPPNTELTYLPADVVEYFLNRKLDLPQSRRDRTQDEDDEFFRLVPLHTVYGFVELGNYQEACEALKEFLVNYGNADKVFEIYCSTK